MLQEENSTHEEAVRELEERLQEENGVHDEAIRELEKKIADVEQQIKHSSEAESAPDETSSEPAQEASEPLQEISNEIDESARVDALREQARALLQEPQQSEIEVPQDPPKKKRRSVF